MKKILISIFTVLVFSILSGCSDSSSNSQSCDRQARIVSETAFDQVSTSNYSVISVDLNEDCLDITVASSGCSGATWQMNLFGTTEFSSTAIPQKELKIGLVNNEACLAIVQKTVSFNLTRYQLDGQSEVKLLIEGWTTPIIYSY